MKANFYAGAAGLQASQALLDNVGNNLANVNTAGFKCGRVSFNSLLYTRMYANAPSLPLTGHGVGVRDAGLDFTPGLSSPTSFPLDFAIQGEGLFAVQTASGQVQYTRDGAFGIGLVGGEAYLVTQDGAFVLDGAGGRIALPRDAATGKVDTSGARDRLGVFRFDNVSALTPVSGNRFAANATSGPARAAGAGTSSVTAGALEQSNASMVDEMTALITAQRSFQISARVVQAADEVEQAVNALRR